ncbi:hypothetical protein [Actinomadura oligospora]|uniref:hypothetical protein n=1 Tax=Actinomadura oligospora TaxID=111804 RepID=UPI00047C0240|nr:hypothetical protein [Actinomadura oligospora]
MSAATIRRLTPDDVEEILRMDVFSGLSGARLAAETAAGDDYLWLGMAGSSGRLFAAHRGMRWGRHLLLKGVFVEEAERGSGAAPQLAFALRSEARAHGFAGIAAWVEPHMAEAALAGILRLRQTGPYLHRYEIPLHGPRDAAGGRPANAGTIAMGPAGEASFAPGVEDLFAWGETYANGEQVTHWVMDGPRFVLSACPSPATTELPRLTAHVSPLARAQGAQTLEVPVQATDLVAALSLTNTGARRLSRTPVRLGRFDFAPRPANATNAPNATNAVDAGRRSR